MADAALRDRLEAVWQILVAEYPDRRPLLVFADPFQLLVAVSLSAQTTDAAVNKVTPALFARWPDAASLAAADPGELEDVIHPLGFFRTKARNLIGAARVLAERHDGAVPREMEALTALPGIGRKSANVLRSQLWDLPAVIVDTHFGRVCRRLGLTEAVDPAKVEREIAALVPEERQGWFSMAVNRHGRRVCTARKPGCGRCPVGAHCPRAGLG